ncbi:MAG: hypothetical protein ACTHLE_08580 [Agriterribacter sp.]
MTRRNFLTLSGFNLLGLATLQEKANAVTMPTDMCVAEFLVAPCRNFNFLSAKTILDPFDGKNKYVLSNFAGNETGSIIIIDPVSGKGENLMLPIGAGAWGLVNWHNEKLIIGTCTEQAYLHVLDLKTRKFAEPIISPNETYFWHMALGADDKVYGGTYPGCTMTQYDPKTNTFRNLGKLTDNPKNQYSRPVYANKHGYVFIWYGFDTSGVKVYHIAKDAFEDFGNPGDTLKEVNDDYVCLENKGKLFFYDAKTLQPIEGKGENDLPIRHIKIQNGQWVGYIPIGDGLIAGLRGQEYFITQAPNPAEDYHKTIPVELKRIPVEALPTAIHTLISDENGKLWGSSIFGQTIFSYDPTTGQYWNSSGVCNGGGEVYGMVFQKGKLYMSSYVGGELTIYDPREEWNQVDNKNPKTLGNVNPDLIRPEGRSVTGPDGNVWTGWSAKYGVYGGGLSCVNTQTNEFKKWYDPIPNQQIAGLAADKNHLYFTTNGGASGLSYNKETKCNFAVWHPENGLVHRIEMNEGVVLSNAIIACGNKIAFSTQTNIQVYDPATKKIAHTIEMNTKDRCGWLIPIKKDIVGAICGSEYVEVNISNGKQKKICDLPGFSSMGTITPKGDVYVTIKSKLYRIKKARF